MNVAGLRTSCAWIALLVVSASGIASGCSPAPRAVETRDAAHPTEPAFPIVARFECGGFALPATFYRDRVVLSRPQGELSLPQVISASGARYSDGRTTFWNKGTEATLESDDGRTTMCEVWTAAGARVGPIRIDMSRQEAEAALTAPLAGERSSKGCVIVRPSRGPDEVQVMLIDDRVARVDVTQRGVATDAGIRVGDPEARVREAYAGRVTQSPHKYTPGHYLTVDDRSERHVVFETDGERVTRYRVGRIPEVDWVEGCG